MGQPAQSIRQAGVDDTAFYEKAVLGTLLWEAETIFPKVVSALDPEMFAHPVHRRVFWAVVDQHREGGPIDAATIYEKAQPMDFRYIADLSDHAMPGSVDHWIDKIRSAAARRRAQELMYDAMNDLGGRDEDLVARFQTMNDEVCKLIAPPVAIGSMRDGIVETIKNIERRNDGELVSTGMRPLDQFVGGFQPGQFWVVAGRTSMGKSSCAQNMALSVARAGHGVGYVAIEGTSDDLRQRLLAITAEVSIQDIASGRLTTEECSRLVQASGVLSDLPILYCDRENIWSRVKAKIQLLKFRDPNLKVVFVDYLGLIKNPKFRDAWAGVADITGEMALLAKSMGIAIVAVVQISRDTEKRKDHRPGLADLRGCGSVEQDADVILLLYRPHYYDKKADDLLCQIAIAKQRNGPTGHIEVNFNGRCVRFFDR